MDERTMSIHQHSQTSLITCLVSRGDYGLIFRISENQIQELSFLISFTQKFDGLALKSDHCNEAPQWHNASGKFQLSELRELTLPAMKLFLNSSD